MDKSQKTKVFGAFGFFAVLIVPCLVFGEDKDFVICDFENASTIGALETEYATAKLIDTVGGQALSLELLSSEEQPIVTLNLPEPRRNLSLRRYVEMEIENMNDKPAVLTFWALSGAAWGGMNSAAETASGRERLEPNSTSILRIDLYGRYPGPDVLAPAIDPANVRQLRIIFHLRQGDFKFEIDKIKATGNPPKDTLATSARFPMPEVTQGEPAPGKRVRQKLPAYKNTNVVHVLHLPKNWEPGKLYPIIVEYPGNRFYHKYCHSTGYTEQGRLAYGMSRGKDFICVNMPFISEDNQREQTNGWGSPEKTVDYCLETINHICENYGGDPSAVFVTGFSRGAIACNYIALRDDRIADAWLAFGCNPGSSRPKGQGWHGSAIGWDERTKRLKGRSCLTSSANLGPGVHVDVEYLEDNRNTLAAQEWLRYVLKHRSGTHQIKGRVADKNGKGISGVRVQSGFTHFTLADDGGDYTLRSLVDSNRTVSASKDGYSFKPVEQQVSVAGRDVDEVDFVGTAQQD